MKFLWRNIPIPEPFVIAVLAGGAMQFILPVFIFPPTPILIVSGAILVVLGIGIATWAVMVARENDLEHPNRLLITGPYAYSRNPMYLAWACMTVGLALLVNSLWIMLAMLLAWIYLNAVTIPGEEKTLQQKFGAVYEAYKKSHRRWL